MPKYQDLHALLERCVPKGSVTTYGDVSRYFYGEGTMKNHPIGAMLAALSRRPGDLSHRVIMNDGGLRVIDPQGQADRLEKEGVPLLDKPRRVDLKKAKRAKLT